MIFERQAAQPVSTPKPERIRAELLKLKSAGRSSLASLTRDDGSYVQVAGGGVGCVLEMRDVLANKHLRAFVRTPLVPFEDGTELVCAAGRIKLRRDEWLDIQLVTEAFLAFLAGEKPPSSLEWREISSVVLADEQGHGRTKEPHGVDG